MTQKHLRCCANKLHLNWSMKKVSFYSFLARFQPVLVGITGRLDQTVNGPLSKLSFSITRASLWFTVCADHGWRMVRISFRSSIRSCRKPGVNCQVVHSWSISDSTLFRNYLRELSRSLISLTSVSHLLFAPALNKCCEKFQQFLRYSNKIF